MGIWKKALVTIPAIVIMGSLMGVVSNSGFDNSWYAELENPVFQPPGWVFGAVWTTLYTMLGIALAKELLVVVDRLQPGPDLTRRLTESIATGLAPPGI